MARVKKILKRPPTYGEMLYSIHKRALALPLQYDFGIDKLRAAVDHCWEQGTAQQFYCAKNELFEKRSAVIFLHLLSSGQRSEENDRFVEMLFNRKSAFPISYDWFLDEEFYFRNVLTEDATTFWKTIHYLRDKDVLKYTGKNCIQNPDDFPVNNMLQTGLALYQEEYTFGDVEIVYRFLYEHFSFSVLKGVFLLLPEKDDLYKSIKQHLFGAGNTMKWCVEEYALVKAKKYLF